jgi:hypothetical protein
MKKIVLVLAVTFSMAYTNIGHSATIQLKCTVESIDGQTIVMNCGKGAGKLSKGNKVIIKPQNTKNNASCG